jgi:hypothetical protein
MAEKKDETVTLIAPNGVTVTVAESKKAQRLAAGYRLPEPEKRSPGRPKSASSD